MRISRLVGAGSAVGVLLAAATASAQTSDATFAVQLRAAGSGVFNNGGLSATRVTVLARSSVAARWNGPTGIEGPTAGTAASGTTFTVTVPTLYSSTVVPSNQYTLELTWNDTTVRTASYGPLAVARGANMAGPYTVTNDPPPAAASISCYPQPPSTSTDLYVYWSVPTTRPVDFDRMELHRSTTAGFTPSSTTLVTTLPWGTSNRTVTALTAGTGYYFCLRMVDQYGATSDRCLTTACATTAAVMDAAVDATVDAAVDAADVPGDTVDVLDVVGAADVPRDTTDVATDAGLDVADVPRDTVDASVDVVDAATDVAGDASFLTMPNTDVPANTPYRYVPRAVGPRGETPTGYSAAGLPAGASINPTTGELTWVPGFDAVGMMYMITISAALPGGTFVRQSFTVTVSCPDVDRDGHRDARCPMALGGDCDDARADTAPDAPERCNGIDDNCNGLVDEGDATTLCGPGLACDPASHSCRTRCSTGAECTAAPRMCTTDRVCALCTSGASGDATACAGDPNGRACLADALGGVMCGCSTDADCGGTSSGRVCNTFLRRCVDGCFTGAGRNGCPAGQRCLITSGTPGDPGVCTVDCVSSDVCRTAVPARPVCPEGTGTRSCVECRADVDCAGRTDGRIFCDTAAGRCAPCVTGRSASLCITSGAGSACLPGGVCGCNADADCGGPGSGRICDATTRACRGGCRPAGGVTCPAGATCVTVTATAGRCEVPVPDAGVMTDAGADVADASNDAAGDASDAAMDAPDATMDAAMDAPANDVADVTDASDAGDASAANDVADGADGSMMNGQFQGGFACSAAHTSERPGARLLLGAAAVAATLLRRSRRRTTRG